MRNVCGEDVKNAGEAPRELQGPKEQILPEVVALGSEVRKTLLR